MFVRFVVERRVSCAISLSGGEMQIARSVTSGFEWQYRRVSFSRLPESLNGIDLPFHFGFCVNSFL